MWRLAPDGGIHSSSENALTEFRLSGVYLAIVMTLTPAANAADGNPGEARKRVRDLGIEIGTLTPGPLNAITDVAGVRVGHVTLNRGDGKLQPGKGPVRTGDAVPSA